MCRAFLLIAVALACFALSATARAEGGLPGGNTAEGVDALESLTGGGEDNTAMGAHALSKDTEGEFNTAMGFHALALNRVGDRNTAIGMQVLRHNKASSNTAIGAQTLQFNTTGENNTGIGDDALESNDAGSSNTAAGVDALQNNNGSFNTANGAGALQNNQTGNNNTADGFGALMKNTGSGNIALGISAGLNLITGDANIDIGNPGVDGESDTIRIGASFHRNVFIAGISGVTVAGGVGVIIDSNGHLGTVVSSERFKDEIKPMDKASEAILALKPVTFRYKHELDPEGIPQFGLVAEQVEKVNPDLVARDEEGKPYTVRYEAVNAMLLNEFLKEHRKVEEQGRNGQQQEASISELKSIVARQQKEIETLTTGLKKVSEEIEVSKAAPQLVANDQ